ncbi:hypothetical protein NBRC116583_18600 [Arenicella sp. 4NH20-0111]|uniref:Rieske 2Fe-2S domain-containing protein n=1 Tax=Arenicella sp. 4NH20-0111 TaxID=3127648 RepID=UPI003106FDED
MTNFFNYLIDLLRRLLPSVGTALPHVGSYQRDIPTSLARMFENALDYKHLPWLHQSTFSELQIIESGDWGWRAIAHLSPKSPFNKMELELRLDRDKSRWVTRTLSGLGKGTEVWTVAMPTGTANDSQNSEHGIRVVVDFFVPKLPRFLHAFYAQAYQSMYQKLYDEDETMMLGRQRALDQKKQDIRVNEDQQNETELLVGHTQSLDLNGVTPFELAGKRYGLVYLNERWQAFSAVCPHRLGPLNQGKIIDGSVECPWHGYRFEISSGRCLTHQSLTLSEAPTIHVSEEGAVMASFADQSLC